MIKTLLLLAVATTMATAQNIGDCQRAYRPAADPADCSALLQIARCFALAGLDEMSNTSATRQAAEQFMLAQQLLQPGCAGAVDRSAPKIRTTRGDVTFEVGEGADVRAFRFRRETVSLFDMSSRLQSVETQQSVTASAVDTAVQQVRSEMAAALSTQASTSASTLAAGLSSLVATSESTLAALVTSNSRAVAAAAAATAATAAAAATAAQDLSTATAAQVNTMNASITAVAARSNIMIGYKECRHSGANNADSVRTVMSCQYRKQRSDTKLVISHNAVMRHINGNSIWQLLVDNQQCRGPGNQGDGNLQIRMHGSNGANQHFPAYVKGMCHRTTAQARLNAGVHTVSFRQTYVSGDSYWGWDSTSRIMVEEWTVDPVNPS